MGLLTKSKTVVCDLTIKQPQKSKKTLLMSTTTSGIAQCFNAED